MIDFFKKLSPLHFIGITLVFLFMLLLFFTYFCLLNPTMTKAVHYHVGTVMILIMSFIAYFWGTIKLTSSNINIRSLLTYALIISGVLLFLWPVLSIDIFFYMGIGRVFTEFGQNPYVIPYASMVSDTLYPSINNVWSALPSFYGPLLTSIFIFLSSISGDNILVSLFIFKLFFVLINLLNIFLLYKLFKNKFVVYLYALNPLVLFELAGTAHNDSLINFFLLLSLVFILSKRQLLLKTLLSATFIIFSFLVKFTTIIFIPIFFLFTFFRFKTKRDKLVYVVSLAFLVIANNFVFFFPYGNMGNIIGRIGSHMMWEMPFLARSPLVVIFYLFFDFFYIKNALITSLLWSRAIFTLIYIFVFATLLKIKNIKSVSSLILLYTGASLLFYLTSLNWMAPWYFVVPIMLSAISYHYTNKPFYIKIINVMTLYGIIEYLFIR